MIQTGQCFHVQTLKRLALCHDPASCTPIVHQPPSTTGKRNNSYNSLDICALVCSEAFYLSVLDRRLVAASGVGMRLVGQHERVAGVVILTPLEDGHQVKLCYTYNISVSFHDSMQ